MPNVVLYNPIDGSQIGEILVESPIFWYEIFQSALDHLPKSPEFLQALEPLKTEGTSDILEAWFVELAKISTTAESPDCVCFVLEDWITEWYIADFIDKRFKILEWKNVDPML